MNSAMTFHQALKKSGATYTYVEEVDSRNERSFCCCVGVPSFAGETPPQFLLFTTSSQTLKHLPLFHATTSLHVQLLQFLPAPFLFTRRVSSQHVFAEVTHR